LTKAIPDGTLCAILRFVLTTFLVGAICLLKVNDSFIFSC
jgi:hypothetical protein